MGVANNLVQSDGLICYVTSESWLDSPTYTLVRKYFLDNYNIKKIIRLGPYFKGIAQPASVIIMEKDSSKGRSQKIQFLDWSDISNSNYSYTWINNNLKRITEGSIKKSEWKNVVANGDHCILLPSSYNYNGLEKYLMTLDELFPSRIIQGAQPGFSPLFMDKDKAEVVRKVRMLFSGTDANLKKLSKELSKGVRGGENKSFELVKQAYEKIVSNKAGFDLVAIREVYAHFKEEDDEDVAKIGYCYFDSRIWHRPRVENRVSPKHVTIWDSELKLIFRDFSDNGKKKKTIEAFIDEGKRIVDNHCINGGSQVVFFNDDFELTVGDFDKDISLSAREWCFYLYAIFNSTYSLNWSKENTKQRLKVPVSAIFVEQMRQISKLGVDNQLLIEQSKLKTLSELEIKRLETYQLSIMEQIGHMSLMVGTAKTG